MEENKKNILIFGYNRFAVEAINRMNVDDHHITIADHRPERLKLASENGFKTAAVDYRSDDDLKTAGLGKTVDTIFCFFPEDSENVFLTLSARAIDPQLKIIAIVEDQDAGEKLVAAGANKVIDPYQICGRKIFDQIKKPEITQIIDHTVFGRHDLNIAEIVIPENSYLENTYCSQLNISHTHNLVLIGIVDIELGDDLYFVTGERDHKLNAGDILVILGPSQEIKAYQHDINRSVENE